jgi:quercetin dioxygenase-like cupin family protein
MDILNSIEFSPGKPTVLQIKKTETIRMFCVALGKDQLLQKHQAKVPSLLIVLKGYIQFRIGDEAITLREFDTYQIPVQTDHEVVGLGDENVFLITQELK